MPRGGRGSGGGRGRGSGGFSRGHGEDSSKREHVQYPTKQWRKAEQADEDQKKMLEKKMLNKYHYLKFVEKVKVNRKIKSCRKRLVAAMQAASDKQAANVTDLREELKMHEADLEYIEHYPN